MAPYREKPLVFSVPSELYWKEAETVWFDCGVRVDRAMPAILPIGS
jgi:hypothetical protein